MKLTSSQISILGSLIFKRIEDRLSQVEALSEKTSNDLQFLNHQVNSLQEDAQSLDIKQKLSSKNTVSILDELKFAYTYLVEGNLSFDQENGNTESTNKTMISAQTQEFASLAQECIYESESHTKYSENGPSLLSTNFLISTADVTKTVNPAFLRKNIPDDQQSEYDSENIMKKVIMNQPIEKPTITQLQDENRNISKENANVISNDPTKIIIDEASRRMTFGSFQKFINEIQLTRSFDSNNPDQNSISELRTNEQPITSSNRGYESESPKNELVSPGSLGEREQRFYPKGEIEEFLVVDSNRLEKNLGVATEPNSYKVAEFKQKEISSYSTASEIFESYKISRNNSQPFDTPKNSERKQTGHYYDEYEKIKANYQALRNKRLAVGALTPPPKRSSTQYQSSKKKFVPSLSIKSSYTGESNAFSSCTRSRCHSNDIAIECNNRRCQRSNNSMPYLNSRSNSPTPKKSTSWIPGSSPLRENKNLHQGLSPSRNKNYLRPHAFSNLDFPSNYQKGTNYYSTLDNKIERTSTIKTQIVINLPKQKEYESNIISSQRDSENFGSRRQRENYYSTTSKPSPNKKLDVNKSPILDRYILMEKSLEETLNYSAVDIQLDSSLINDSSANIFQQQLPEFYSVKKITAPQRLNVYCLSPTKSPELKNARNDIIESVQKKKQIISPHLSGSTSKSKVSNQKTHNVVVEWND